MKNYFIKSLFIFDHALKPFYFFNSLSILTFSDSTFRFAKYRRSSFVYTYSDIKPYSSFNFDHSIKIPLYDDKDLYIKVLMENHDLDPFSFSDPLSSDIRDSVNVEWNSFSLSKKKSIVKGIYGLQKYSFSNDVDLDIVPDHFDESLESFVVMINQIKLFIESLNSNTVYKCLIVGIDDEMGVSMGKKSFFVTSKTDPYFIVYQFVFSSNALKNYYSYVKNFVNWKLAFKIWVGHDSIREGAYNAVADAMDSLNVKQFKKTASVEGKKDRLRLSNYEELFGKYINLKAFRAYDFIAISKYGALDSIQDGVHVYLFKNLVINVTPIDLNSWKVVVVDKNRRTAIISWIDSYINKAQGKWKRLFYDYAVACFYTGDVYSHYEAFFKSDNWKPTEKDYEFDADFGSLDIETFKLKGGGGDCDGKSIPYCCGFRDSKGKIQVFYLDKGEDPFNVVARMLKALVATAKYHNHIFYVHNLSGFDSRFILEAIGLLDYSYDAKSWGKSMREIYKINIKKKVGSKRVSVTLVDSNYILSPSLETLGEKFVVETKKGYFPYEFPALDNLFYEGEVPDYKYYPKKLCYNEYLDMKSQYCNGKLWSTKNETVEYLKKDLECLYQVMYKFNRGIFNDFSVNVTKVSSYSALSKYVYLSNFYEKCGVKIPIISGFMESEIRKAYFGGIVDIIQHTLSTAYKYDSNSHYPAAMVNDMPVGDPTVTDLKELDKIFGFCYVTVTAPSADVLPTAILPAHDEFGNIHCPRGTFKGIYFSEELKDVIKYGYKIQVHSAIVFTRGKGLFDDFISELFKRKADAKVRQDGVYEMIYKLLQNSLYGKSGEREIEEQYDLMKSADVEKLEKKKDIHQVHAFGNRSLVRSSEYSEEFKVLFKLAKINLDESEGELEEKASGQGEKIRLLVPPRKKGGVKSSVAIAAAITSYARMSMNKYKNIPDNKYLGGDTDSAIMQRPLESKYVGPCLGLMKLECIIKRGLQADKKLYYIVDSKDNIIIKSRGIGRDSAGIDILKFEDFIKIFTGVKITVRKTKFITKNDGVYIIDQAMSVQINPSVYQYIRSEIGDVLSKGGLNDPVRYSLALIINRELAKVRDEKNKYSMILYDSTPKVPVLYKPRCLDLVGVLYKPRSLDILPVLYKPRCLDLLPLLYKPRCLDLVHIKGGLLYISRSSDGHCNNTFY